MRERRNQEASGSPNEKVTRKLPSMPWIVGSFFCGAFVMMVASSTLLSRQPVTEDVRSLQDKMSKALIRLEEAKARVENATASTQSQGTNGLQQNMLRGSKNCPVGSRDGLLVSQTQSQLFEHLLIAATYKGYQPSVLSNDPWIIQFDTFLDEEETVDLISEIEKRAVFQADSTNQIHRNASSWNCNSIDRACFEWPNIKNYRDKLLDLGLEQEHSEGLTLLKYDQGGYYKKHHDIITGKEQEQNNVNCGSRIVTVMCYLTDVEAGGSTAFFHLDMEVKPKMGRMLIWANTRNDKPLEKDRRTVHEAQVVSKGTKMTATSWYDQYDWQANVAAGCCSR